MLCDIMCGAGRAHDCKLWGRRLIWHAVSTDSLRAVSHFKGSGLYKSISDKAVLSEPPLNLPGKCGLAKNWRTQPVYPPTPQDPKSLPAPVTLAGPPQLNC